MVKNALTWSKEHWKLLVGIIMGVLVVLSSVVPNGGSSNGSGLSQTDQQKSEKAKKEAEAEVKKFQGGDQNVDSNATDKLLLSSQSDLTNDCGVAPKGFIWSMSCKPMSLGDKKMEPEDVVYTYLQALSKLNMDTAEFYSRDSDVVKSYLQFYDNTNYNPAGDYKLNFNREIYKQSMMSLEILGVENTSVFAQNQNTYTVKARMIDLSNKDFWKSKQDEVFKRLYYLDTAESDSAKKDEYVYSLILGYYQGNNVKKKDFTFDITVQKYPDLDSGWLVSSDQQLDSEFRYKDGNEVSNYIDQQYQDYKIQRSLKDAQNDN